MKRLEQIKRRFELNLSSPKEYGHLMSNPEANIEYLIGLLEQAEKALQYYDTLYANIESNIEHGELITDWLRRQGETARTALKSIQGDE